MTIDIGAIELWHRRASAQRKPSFSLAVGCFLEEVAEAGEAVEGGRWLSSTLTKLDDEAHHFKRGFNEASVTDPVALADMLCDVIWTAVGVGLAAGVDMQGALNEVSRSNWSKAVNGEFKFDANGKIAKAQGYSKPQLDGFV